MESERETAKLLLSHTLRAGGHNDQSGADGDSPSQKAADNRAFAKTLGPVQTMERLQPYGAARLTVAGDDIASASDYAHGMSEVTQILSRIDRGDSAAAAELLPLVYDELRRLASARMLHEQPGQTLQATALVHEAYLRLVDVKQPQQWDSRGHFFAAAAEAMRRILVDNARRKQAEIHGGGRTRVQLAEGDWLSQAAPDEIVELDDSLAKLGADDAAAAQIAKLRVFAGMSIDEAAECLGMSRATAYRHWTYARAFLRHERLG